MYPDKHLRDWHKMFVHMDDDKSGRITYREFLGMAPDGLGKLVLAEKISDFIIFFCGTYVLTNYHVKQNFMGTAGARLYHVCVFVQPRICRYSCTAVLIGQGVKSLPWSCESSKSVLSPEQKLHFLRNHTP